MPAQQRSKGPILSLSNRFSSQERVAHFHKPGISNLRELEDVDHPLLTLPDWKRKEKDNIMNELLHFRACVSESV